MEEQRYYEFSNALLEGDVLALADVALEGQVQPDETPVLFHFSTTLMLSMMDRLMGGDGCGQPTPRRLQFHQFGAEAL